MLQGESDFMQMMSVIDPAGRRTLGLPRSAERRASQRMAHSDRYYARFAGGGIAACGGQVL